MWGLTQPRYLRYVGGFQSLGGLWRLMMHPHTKFQRGRAIQSTLSYSELKIKNWGWPAWPQLWR